MTPHFLLNHVGFHPDDDKRAWLQGDEEALAAIAASPGHGESAGPTGPAARRVAVVDVRTNAVVHTCGLQPAQTVPGWRGRAFAALDFSALRTPGEYRLALDTGFPPLVSARFQVGRSLFGHQVLSDLVHYFKSQRCTGLYDLADRRAPLLDTREPRDVHGGWYDASGDCSKYLSHLSYANAMNPQQVPLVAWTLMDGRAPMGEASAWFAERVVDEALHGADFLVRMQDPAGFFYMTVFDRWSKDPAQREICAYATQQGHKFAIYQAGYRQGGGVAVAALARASALPRDGEGFTRAAYLAAARLGFDVLQARNRQFLDDGVENLLDDYCALLAATELLGVTGEVAHAQAACDRVARIAARQDTAGGDWGDDARTRSFFHASDAGLVHVALARFIEVASGLRPGRVPASSVAQARHALALGLRRELALAASTPQAPNPFGYPRQYVALPGRAPRAQFFIPHANESGYWWQGENARLGSLAAAARRARALGLADGDPPFDAALDRHARCALDWLFGANPFDTCMLQGAGHHPARYEPGYWNAPGGVCNGITSGLDDEDDIDFRKPEDTVPTHSWRWTEQWLPHAAWLFSALAWGQTEPPAPPFPSPTA